MLALPVYDTYRGRMNDSEKEMLGDASSDPANSAIKNPADWVTGDEPATAPQKSYLDTLAREAGEEIPASVSKAEASEHIDRLQHKTGRGVTDTDS